MGESPRTVGSRRAKAQHDGPRGAPANRNDRPFYSVASLAAKLAISERTVRDMLNRGEIPCYRIGPQRRIDPIDVDTWLEQRKEQR
jgi:excisionase family DNA binding protein